MKRKPLWITFLILAAVSIGVSTFVANQISVNQKRIKIQQQKAEQKKKDKAKEKKLAEDKEKELSNDSVIYLTFDDGPNETTTPQLLNILKEKGVKATFFVTGHGPDYLIKEEHDEGHTVALHTFTHDYAIVYSSLNNYQSDLQQVSDRVYNITGVRSNMVRLPGGSSNTVSNSYSPNIMKTILPTLIQQGYQYFDWNVSAGDGAVQQNSDQPYYGVVNGLKPHRDNVVLMHDTKQTSVDAVARIIDFAKNNGYRFALLTKDSFPAHQVEP